MSEDNKDERQLAKEKADREFNEDRATAIKLQSSRRFQLRASYGDILGEKMYNREIQESERIISDKKLRERKALALELIEDLEKQIRLCELQEKARARACSGLIAETMPK